MLRVRLFGGLVLEADGRALEPPRSRRTRALLGWLALRPGMHARSEVAALLWPDVLDSSARASLRTALVELRRALGPARDLVLTTRTDVGLDRSVWVDAAAFDELVAAGELEEAVSLCDGVLLAGIDDDWAYEARDEYSHRLGAVLAQLAAEAETRGDLGRATELSRRRVALDPLSEEAQRELIRRLADSGDVSAALAAYSRFSERLVRDLGIAPSAATRDLVAEIRARPAGPDETGAQGGRFPLPSPLAQRETTGFAGRAAERGRLHELLAGVRTGRRQVAFLAGDAGIGKTRLAAEFARGAHADGAAVLYGRSYESGVVPYQAFVEALSGFAATRGADELDAQLHRTGPEVTQLFSSTSGTPPDADWARAGAEAARYQLFESTTALLADLCREGPVILILDDLHWADRPTLLLLEHLARAPVEVGLLILGTYRDSELPPSHPLSGTLLNLRRERRLERIFLKGLEEDHVAELISDLAGNEPPPAFVRAIHRDTEGNPFFVEEMLRHLIETGSLRRDAGGWSWDAASRDGVPEGVKAVIAHRVGRLDEECQRALTAAAVVGREFDAAVVAPVLDAPVETAIELLGRAVTAGVINDDATALGRYSFVHALINEALSESVDRTQRAQLHLKVAEVMEALYADDREPHLPALAHHFMAAGGLDTHRRAGTYARQAGERAMELFAYEDAVGHFEQALRTLDGASDAGLRCDLLLSLGEALSGAGEQQRARQTFTDAATTARAAGDARRLARAAVALAGSGVEEGVVDPTVLALLREALEELDADDTPIRARTLARLAMELDFAEQPEERRVLTEEAVAVGRRAGDAETLAFCLDARLWALAAEESPDERLRVADEVIELAERVRNLELLLDGNQWRLLALLERGEMGDVDAAIERCLDLAAQTRRPFHRAAVAALPAMRALFDGRFEEAERIVREALALAQRAGNQNAVLGCTAQLLLVARERGRAEEGLSLIGETGGLTHSWQAVYAQHLVEAGREDEGRSEFERLAANGFEDLPRDRARQPALIVLAELCAPLGDARRAARLYDLLLPYAGRFLISGRAVISYGSAERYLGLMAATTGDLEQAKAHFERALVENAEAGAWPWLAHTKVDYATTLLARARDTDQDEGRRLLAEALDAAVAMGMTALEAKAHAASKAQSRAIRPVGPVT
jgi:DNA-binding SARP family transcriptional activator/tetratricopeptide (TPR) repeat protein